MHQHARRHCIPELGEKGTSARGAAYASNSDVPMLHTVSPASCSALTAASRWSAFGLKGHNSKLLVKDTEYAEKNKENGENGRKRKVIAHNKVK